MLPGPQVHWRLGLERAGVGRGLRLDTCLCSTLTHSTVRRHFLAYADRDHLEPEEKQALKRLVEEQLLKMQSSALQPPVQTASALKQRMGW